MELYSRRVIETFAETKDEQRFAIVRETKKKDFLSLRDRTSSYKIKYRWNITLLWHY